MKDGKGKSLRRTGGLGGLDGWESRSLSEPLREGRARHNSRPAEMKGWVRPERRMLRRKKFYGGENG